MKCDNCEVHKMYLERIIATQNDNIEYLKSIISIKNPIYVKTISNVENSIFDIIDHNFELINMQNFIAEIQNTYPANENIVGLLNQLLIYNESKLFIKEKSNLIKFINKKNKIEYVEINEFSKMIAEYIFSMLKPNIENNMKSVNAELETETENNMIRNIMLLRDNKFQTNYIVKLLNRLNSNKNI